MISASQLTRLIKCPGSYALPSSDRDTDASQRGTEHHEVLAKRVQEACAELKLPGVPVAAWRAETSFALNVSDGTVQLLGQHLGRDYSKASPFDVIGTCDAFAVEITPQARHGYVVDWKTGHADLGKPESSHQLLFYALCIARFFALETVTIAFGRTYGRDPIDATPRYIAADVDIITLDAFASELIRAYHLATTAKMAAVKGVQPHVVEGDHCTWCPARNSCPARMRLVEMVARAQGISTREGYPVLYEFAQRLRGLLKDCEAALHAEAAANPIEFPDGRRWGKYTTQGNEKIDKALAQQVLIRHLPTNALELDVSKASIERMAKAAGDKAKAKAILDELRAMGAVQRGYKTEFGFIPDEGEKEDAA